VSQYASRGQLAQTGLPSGALEEVDGGKQDEFLVLSSGTIDSYLRGRYRLPITGELGTANTPNTYPPELQDACLAISAYRLLCFRGFNPDDYDSNFKLRHDFYLGDISRGTKGWLDKLSAGAVSLDLALDASPAVAEGGGFAVDGSRRGFDNFEGNGVGVGEPIGSFWGSCK
jgi:phage gp36-like protein